MEYYPILKRNELSTQATKWINFRTIMLRKRVYNINAEYLKCVLQFIQKS